jgi:hypothetical protein
LFSHDSAVRCYRIIARFVPAPDAFPLDAGACFERKNGRPRGAWRGRFRETAQAAAKLSGLPHYEVMRDA